MAQILQFIRPFDCIDSQTLAALYIAFDKAILSIEGGALPLSVREVIASRMLDQATRGERDPDALCRAALNGQVAALNMMGRAHSYAAVPFFWTKHFDLSNQYVGYAESWDDLAITGDLANRDGVVRFIKGKRLLAVATVERNLAALEEERAWEMAGGPRSL